VSQHSPRAQPGQDDGPVVEDASDSENIEEAGPVNAMDLLSSFLVQHSWPVERALLPVPTRSQEGIEPVLQERRSAGEEKGKHIARLAAKPTANWTAMEKV
jgi:hypothetical protein